MLEQDQREVRAHAWLYKRSPKSPNLMMSRKQLTKRNLQRAKRALQILNEIGAPTSDNIGTDGAEALSVIALHTKYTVMKQVLVAFEAAHKKNPESIYREVIPALKDRVLMLERKKQRFGSQWLVGADGKFFLYPVADFKYMNERRVQYGLSRARYPRDLAYGIPKGPLPPEAQDSDQRQPTPEEYDDQMSEALD